MIELRPTSLDGVIEVRTPRIGDQRGFFSETWSERSWQQAGMQFNFVQDNHSLSARGVLRGLHYQLPPAAQDKLVRVTRGSVFDVALDIRRNSPQFGRWFGLVLSASEWNQLLIPAGFAHGFLALEDGSEVQYKVSSPYDPRSDRAIDPLDQAIGIEWPWPADEIMLSAKDRTAPALADAETF